MKNKKQNSNEIRYSTIRNGITFYTLEEKGTVYYSWTSAFEEGVFKRNPHLLKLNN